MAVERSKRKKTSRPRRKIGQPTTRTSEDGWISWDSPELRPALTQQITRACSSWFAAVQWAPKITEAPIVAGVLEALRAAVETGDEAALRVLDEAARRARGETVRLGGRHPDRTLALDRLARHMDNYLSRGTRRCACRGCKTIRGEPIEGTPDVYCAARPGWKFMPSLSAAEMANGFMAFLSSAEPFTRELKEAGALRPGGFVVDEKGIGAVTRAFDRQLEDKQRTSGEDLVRVGVRALGYSPSKAKHLFDYRDQRDQRARGRATRPTTAT